ncbi:MAG: hypothetical protein ACI3VK_06015 [Oscillospiraceae bacterium]
MNKEKFSTIIAAVLVLVTVLALSGCHNADEAAIEAADDEIALQIKLDIKEDIGLLIVDYKANGTECSGGTSNADKSLIKHDELITYTLSKQAFDNPSDAENMSIQFSVITEYVDPNYENVYPAEYTKPLDPISLKANFGETYYITISGDKINGYKAVLEP